MSGVAQVLLAIYKQSMYKGRVMHWYVQDKSFLFLKLLQEPECGEVRQLYLLDGFYIGKSQTITRANNTVFILHYAKSRITPTSRCRNWSGTSGITYLTVTNLGDCTLRWIQGKYLGANYISFLATPENRSEGECKLGCLTKICRQTFVSTIFHSSLNPHRSRFNLTAFSNPLKLQLLFFNCTYGFQCTAWQEILSHIHNRVSDLTAAFWETSFGVSSCYIHFV